MYADARAGRDQQGAQDAATRELDARAGPSHVGLPGALRSGLNRPAPVYQRLFSHTSVEIYEIIRRCLFEEWGEALDHRRIVDEYF